MQFFNDMNPVVQMKVKESEALKQLRLQHAKLETELIRSLQDVREDLAGNHMFYSEELKIYRKDLEEVRAELVKTRKQLRTLAVVTAVLFLIIPATYFIVS